MSDPKRIIVSRIPNGVREGDVLEEEGPRIGVRSWRVMYIASKRVHDHCFCLPLNDPASDDHVWRLRRE